MVGGTRHSCLRATRCSHLSSGLYSYDRAWTCLALVSWFRCLVFLDNLNGKDVYLNNLQGFSLCGCRWRQVAGADSGYRPLIVCLERSVNLLQNNCCPCSRDQSPAQEVAQGWEAIFLSSELAATAFVLKTHIKSPLLGLLLVHLQARLNPGNL